MGHTFCPTVCTLNCMCGVYSEKNIQCHTKKHSLGVSPGIGVEAEYVSDARHACVSSEPCALCGLGEWWGGVGYVDSMTLLPTAPPPLPHPTTQGSLAGETSPQPYRVLQPAGGPSPAGGGFRVAERGVCVPENAAGTFVDKAAET